MPVDPYLDDRPDVGHEVQLAPDAYVIGKVVLAGPAVLGSCAVIRGDQSNIEIGPWFSIGQRSTIHVDPGNPTRIGRGVWLGANVVVHGCTLGDGVRVEDGGIVLSRALVGSGSIVAPGALVTEGASHADNSYIEGSPGRRTRETTMEERAETLSRTGTQI